MSFEVHKSTEWALTEDARAACVQLMSLGVKDADLALSLLEQLWPERAIYNLEDEDDAE